MSKGKILGIAAGVVLVAGVLGWMFTAPYLGNTGLARTPGIILGGTLTPAPDDFAPLHETHQGPILMKQVGFPPFVNYLSWVGQSDGVITATRPDGGRWAQRVRDDGGDGWLRIGDATYEMRAIEIHGDERIEMLRLWAGDRSIDELVAGRGDPIRDWEVFFWVPR